MKIDMYKAMVPECSFNIGPRCVMCMSQRENQGMFVSVLCLLVLKLEHGMCHPSFQKLIF